MAKNIPLDNIAHARAFIEKFGFTNITVDQFDVFIIDRGLAVDPETSNVQDNAYKGFVQRRNAVRRLLNTAGAWINGSSYQIVVSKEKGFYTISPWALDANEFAKVLGKQVDTYVKARVAYLEGLRNKAKGLIAEYGEDDNLHDSLELLSAMGTQGIIMHSKIGGLVRQYDLAYTSVVAQIEQAMQRRLEEKGEE